MKLPDNLPPLPPVPEGFDRWEYRGKGWDSQIETTFSACFEEFADEGWSRPAATKHLCGHVEAHFIEAVRDQPAESAATGVEARVCEDIAERPSDATAGSAFAACLTTSLRGMSGFYAKHPTPGHIDPVSAIQMALADVAVAVERAAKNEVWAGPGKWEPNIQAD